MTLGFTSLVTCQALLAQTLGGVTAAAAHICRKRRVISYQIINGGAWRQRLLVADAARGTELPTPSLG